MNAVIFQLIEMVFMILLGYGCAKVNITGPEFNRFTSPVLTNVLLPATILKSMMGLNVSLGSDELFYVIALFFIMMGVAGCIGVIASRALKCSVDDRGVILCVIMYMNISFVGFPLVESYYGSEGMLFACLSCVPMNILMFSAGVAAISGDKTDGMKLKQILNVPLVATLVGVVFMAMNFRIPEVVIETIHSLANATVPVSMIILGSSLAAIPFKSAFNDFRIYVVAAMRLIICPVATYLLLKLFVKDEVLLGTITILASTPVAVLMTPLCVQYGRDDQLPSKSIFISTLLSVFTMPLIIWLFL